MSAAHTHVRRTASAHGQQAVSPSSSHARRSGLLGDTPHIEGSTDCRCSSCHLKPYFFPRRQDGKIVLPDPLVTRRIQNCGRTSLHRAGQVDLGEGTANLSSLSLSGPGVPAGSRRPIQVISTYPRPDDLGPPRQIPLAERHSRPSSPILPRRTPHHPRTIRADPGSPSESRSHRQSVYTTGDLELDYPGEANASSSTGSNIHGSNPYAEIHSNTTLSKTGERRSWPDPYATIVEEAFPQFFNTFPTGLGTQEVDLSGNSTNDSHRTSFSKDSDPKSSPDTTSRPFQHPAPLDIPPRDDSQSPVGQYPGEATFSLTNPDHAKTSNSKPLMAKGPADDPPMLFRFNSCPNPLPTMWSSRADRTDRPQLVTTPSQTQTGMLRFENSLIPDSQPAGTTESTREHPVFPIRWDTERKRRQGYFAQQQGVKKSSFRHYNKASCDFEKP